MATYLKMPGVSADADEAVLGEWYVSEGDAVASGSPLCAVETDKANVDVNAEVDVTVFKLLAESGATVVVGDPIAVLLDEGEDAAAGQKLIDDLLGAAPAAAPAEAVEEAAAPVEAAAPAAATGDGKRVFSSPLARKLAAEAGLRVEDIAGTGPNGRVVRADVERTVAAGATAPAAPAAEAPAPVVGAAPATAAPAPRPAPARASEGGFVDTPHNKMRKAIASRLVESKTTAPHFYLKASLVVDDLLALRKQINAAGDVKISVNDLIVAAAAKALAAFPEMNVIWTDEAIRQFADVDVAVAVQTERGLMTPVVRGADRLALGELSATIKDLATRAADNKLQAAELSGGTMTITNLGMFGVEEFAAIINPPQAAILAVGAAKPTPVVVDGEVVVKNVLTVVLSVDHRPVDGVLAAKWLGVFTSFVEAPLRILV
jgi:pyruvate dehydrogenase E2 component (dihydrolipoamide acetyltransferase)